MNVDNLCKHLRNKKVYIPALADQAFNQNPEEDGHSSHCWCNCTLTETGPDDRPVAPQICNSSRACYES